MKKQVVAILIALVVISSLLTASVLSEEAYKPIIQSVTVSPTEIVNGGEVTLKVIAKSNAPVESVCYQESMLTGKRVCIGGTCINVGDDLWKCEWIRSFSEWAPAATYTYYHIYVRNAGELISDEWPHSIGFNVTRSDHSSTPVPTPTPVTPTPPEEEGFGGYNVSLCDAIVISIGNATVTDFLNATNITTVQVSNFKGYKGENTWRVQWSFSNRSLDVYINVATGNIVGIEEQKESSPSAQASETPRWHPVISFMGTGWSTFGHVPSTTLETFSIRGEKWRVQYLSSADAQTREMTEKYGESDYSYFLVRIYSEDGEKLSDFRCTTVMCNKTQNLYRGDKKGADRYYLKLVNARGLDWWELLVEDYY